MLESAVAKHLKTEVAKRQGETRRAQWIGRNHAPDFRVMLPGACFWVETKRPGKDAAEAQAREHKRMRGYGETVYVWDTLEKIDEWFKTYDCVIWSKHKCR